MEFNSFGPAVGRLGSDSSRGAKLRQSRSRGGAEPLTLTTVDSAVGLIEGTVFLVFVSAQTDKPAAREMNAGV